VVSAVLCSGCGSAGEESPSAVAASFARAVAAHRGAEACGLLARATRAELEQSAGTRCAGAILDEDLLTAGAVEQTETFGDVAGGLPQDVVFLSEFKGRWRVMAAGCAPVPAKPYDCQLREADVRALFVVYLLVIWIGRGYFIVMGALHT
jgi:hypothetical protein